MAAIDLSLDRLRRFVVLLPPYSTPTIHIAGTNGKGSVSAYISHILAASQPPLNVGRFNSPHLMTPHDSITINNQPISLDLYASVRSLIDKLDRENGTGLRLFELLTMTALYIFQDQKVDVAIVEVGMGGRLDATNILPSSMIIASALTSVDLDHQAFLGPTIAHIAREKASIARPGKPFILGKQAHESVNDVVKEVVQSLQGILLPALVVRRISHDSNLPLFSLDPANFSTPPMQNVSFTLPCFPNQPLHALLALHGDHQLDNLGIALGVISSLLTHSPPALTSPLVLSTRLTPQTITTGIQSTRWPGRLSFHTLSVSLRPHSPPKQSLILVDGAHNPSSARSLTTCLIHLISQSKLPHLQITYLLALSHSPPKTPLDVLTPLLPLQVTGVKIRTRVALLTFSQPAEMPWIKCVPVSDLEQVVSSLAPGIEMYIPPTTTESNGSTGLLDALKWATQDAGDDNKGSKNQLIVIAGSLYLVADFYRLVSELGNQR
ncbi:hypothetical protein AMATHDRAFT_195470 [Amanita thiersii Skay4041]|uniref:Mur ligase central domain-containing protein n=1 Tax=Amanita thiersii Skay4041 TaxID=703135 RepID=A0A2A9NEM7_9AGAR|nr:hypothetical protein AMATHDRAFT_195470 [Amanita thiersii Skay4041]